MKKIFVPRSENLVSSILEGESFLFLEHGTNRLIHAEAVTCDCGRQGFVNGCGVLGTTPESALHALPFFRIAAVEVGANEEGNVECNRCRGVET